MLQSDQDPGQGEGRGGTEHLPAVKDQAHLPNFMACWKLFGNIIKPQGRHFSCHKNKEKTVTTKGNRSPINDLGMKNDPSLKEEKM